MPIVVSELSPIVQPSPIEDDVKDGNFIFQISNTSAPTGDGGRVDERVTQIPGDTIRTRSIERFDKDGRLTLKQIEKTDAQGRLVSYARVEYYPNATVKSATRETLDENGVSQKESETFGTNGNMKTHELYTATPPPSRVVSEFRDNGALQTVKVYERDEFGLEKLISTKRFDEQGDLLPEAKAGAKPLSSVLLPLPTLKSK